VHGARSVAQIALPFALNLMMEAAAAAASHLRQEREVRRTQGTGKEAGCWRSTPRR
jgi:hypothetical protein